MKKLSKKYHSRQAYQMRQALRRRRRHKVYLNRRNLGWAFNWQKEYKGFKARSRISIRPPANFSLTENYEGVLNFLNRFKRFALTQKCAVRIRFDKIKKIQSGAALVLASELDRWRKVRSTKLMVHKVETWKSKVLETFEELGLFELLGIENHQVPVYGDGPDFKIIKYHCGTDAGGVAAKELRRKIDEKVGEFELNHELYAALTEATANVVHHAYPESFDYAFEILPRHWWMCGAYNVEDKTLLVYVYDQGVGIPRTIHKWKLFDKLMSLLRARGQEDMNADHGQLIELAMEVGRSGTEETHRGNGLGEMRQLIEENQGGYLRIVSGHGEVLFYDEGEPILKNHELMFGGTLIEWSVKL